MYANCTAPAAGRSWLDGGTPKSFSSPWQRWQKESFARQDFRAEASHNRLLTGIKVATRALEVAVSYALKSSWLTLREASPALWCVKSWVKHRMNLGDGHGSAWTLGLLPPAVVPGRILLLFVFETSAHYRERFQTPAPSTLNPSKSNPWTLQSTFNHSKLLMYKCHTPLHILCFVCA